MKLITAVLILSYSVLSFADVLVTLEEDSQHYRAYVSQLTATHQKNELSDFFDSLNAYEEYRETTIAKIFASENGDFRFICEKTSHAKEEMMVSCSFYMQKQTSPESKVLINNKNHAWTFEGNVARELISILPGVNGQVVVNTERKFSVLRMEKLVSLKFNF